MRTSRAAAGIRARDTLIVALALNSGATDAIGFLALGGAFTSVMTGNLVLLGMSVARPGLAVLTAAAIFSYIAGTAAGARLAGEPRAGDPVWPQAVTRTLIAEICVVAVYAAGWEWAGGHPSRPGQVGLLMLNAVALGLQSTAINRFGVKGLSTTYMTGTLTTVVTSLASGRPMSHVVRSLWIISAMLAGAAAAAAGFLFAPRLVPLLQLASLASVILAASRWWPSARTGEPRKLVTTSLSSH
jgi:uncharacterized membrane protein YoaK (UPF0700 family)